MQLNIEAIIIHLLYLWLMHHRLVWVKGLLIQSKFYLLDSLCLILVLFFAKARAPCKVVRLKHFFPEKLVCSFLHSRWVKYTLVVVVVSSGTRLGRLV